MKITDYDGKLLPWGMSNHFPSISLIAGNSQKRQSAAKPEREGSTTRSKDRRAKWLETGNPYNCRVKI